MGWPKSICPKVNGIARLKFQLTYHNVTAQPVNYNTTGIPLCTFEFEHKGQNLEGGD